MRLREVIMLETIVTALIGGVAAESGKVATKAVVDSFRALKELVVRKLGDKSEAAEALTKLEDKPDSDGRKATLAEELKDAKVEDDPELLEAAERLNKAL